LLWFQDTKRKSRDSTTLTDEASLEDILEQSPEKPEDKATGNQNLDSVTDDQTPPGPLNEAVDSKTALETETKTAIETELVVETNFDTLQTPVISHEHDSIPVSSIPDATVMTTSDDRMSAHSKSPQISPKPPVPAKPRRNGDSFKAKDVNPSASHENSNTQETIHASEDSKSDVPRQDEVPPPLPAKPSVQSKGSPVDQSKEKVSDQSKESPVDQSVGGAPTTESASPVVMRRASRTSAEKEMDVFKGETLMIYFDLILKN